MRTGTDDFVENTARPAEMSVTTDVFCPTTQSYSYFKKIVRILSSKIGCGGWVKK